MDFLINQQGEDFEICVKTAEGVGYKVGSCKETLQFIEYMSSARDHQNLI